METFKDAEGRDWIIKITISTVKNVRAICKIDLLDIGGNIFRVLSEDMCLLVDCLYVCCKDECEKRGISDVQFGEGLRGDAIDDATDAFLQELINFFPKARGSVMRQALAKSKIIQEEARIQTEEKIKNLSLESLTASQE